MDASTSPPDGQQMQDQLQVVMTEWLKAAEECLLSGKDSPEGEDGNFLLGQATAYYQAATAVQQLIQPGSQSASPEE